MSIDLDVPHFSHGEAELGDVRLHYVQAGAGRPLVLLHGWPQTWYEWRYIIPRLADRYRIIAPDLRGLGDSSRPATGYDKKSVGGDVYRLLKDHLGIDRFLLVGHDWGGPTAYSIAAQHPDAVEKLAILDVVIPGDGGDFSQGGARWHHAFHRTPELPEALVRGRERVYLSWFYENFGHRPDAIEKADVEEYLRTYTQPGALEAGFAYYRALPQDIADNQAFVARAQLPMAVLGIGGGSSWGRRHTVEESLRRVARHVTGTVVAECGHWIPEEQPDFLAERLHAFFS